MTRSWESAKIEPRLLGRDEILKSRAARNWQSRTLGRHKVATPEVGQCTCDRFARVAYEFRDFFVGQMYGDLSTELRLLYSCRPFKAALVTHAALNRDECHST